MGVIHTEYLKISDKSYDGETIVGDLSIPNREARMTYRTMLREYLQSDIKQANASIELTNSLNDRNFEVFEIILKQLYFKYVSYNDLPRNKQDDYWQQKIDKKIFIMVLSLVY